MKKQNTGYYCKIDGELYLCYMDSYINHRGERKYRVCGADKDKGYSNGGVYLRFDGEKEHYDGGRVLHTASSQAEASKFIEKHPYKRKS